MYLPFVALLRAIRAIVVAIPVDGDGAPPALPRFVAPHYEITSDEPAVRSGVPGLPEPGDELLVEEFGALDGARWTDVAVGNGAADGGPAALQHQPEAAGAQGVVVLAPRRGAMKAAFDVDRDDALVVTVHARSFAPTRPAVLRVVQRIAGHSKPVMTQTPIAAAPTFVDTRFIVDGIKDREHLELRLLAGDGALVIDRIEAQWLRPVEREWLRPHDSLPSARVRVGLVSMDTDTEGCFVPIGGAVRWKTKIPKDAPRLDFSTALRGGDHGGAAEWVVEIDDKIVATRPDRVGPEEGWSRLTPWVVPLDAWAGRDVVVALRCAGDRSVLGFAGAPRVLSAAPADAPPNVILISLDTLRPDRVGPHAGRPSLTPHIDELAQRGALFVDACSTSGWTLPAHTSLFSGLHPLAHGVHTADDKIDPGRVRLLTELYRDAGYSTAAFTSGGFVDPHFGFSRGFETYSVRDPCGFSHESVGLYFTVPGLPLPKSDDEIDATPRPAFDWIRRHADGRFFVFLHTYCVHDYDDDCATQPELQRTALMKRADEGDPAATAELMRRYDVSVGEVDRTLVGGVLALLDELALRERTLVVVVSDHGEEFGEHGRFGHGIALGHEVGAVTMVIGGPGVPAGARIDKPVNLTDVSVTLARLTGLPHDPEWRGVDLFDPPTDEPRCRILYLGTGYYRADAMWVDHWLVQRGWDPETHVEKFTLEKRDPITGAITVVEPTESQRRLLEQRLDHEIAQRLPRTGDAKGDGSDLPESLRERLKELGYLDR